MSGWCSFSQASTTEAKASLISIASMSSSVILARSSTVVVAGMGPVSMVIGSTPARAKAWKRARGRRPSALAFSSLMMSTAEAPSVICEELPAVTLPPSGLKAGLSLASVSTVLSGRMPSSAVSSSSVSVALVVADGHRDDLVLEAALGGGPGGPLVALGREGVELLAGDAPLVGDHLGPDALADQAALLGVAGHHAGPEGVAELAHDRGAHGRAGHALDAGGDHDVVGAGHDALGGEVERLLGGAALAVDGGGRAPTRASRRPARRCARC